MPAAPAFTHLPHTVLALAAAALSVAAAAQTPAKPERLGLCASCHGDSGRASAKSIPNLAAQNLDYLRGAIAQYRSGARDVAAMRAAIAMLGEAELDDVLRWYAAQPAAEPAPQ